MFVTDVSRGTLVRIDDSDFYASLDINDNGNKVYFSTTKYINERNGNKEHIVTLIT